MLFNYHWILNLVFTPITLYALIMRLTIESYTLTHTLTPWIHTNFLTSLSLFHHLQCYTKCKNYILICVFWLFFSNTLFCTIGRNYLKLKNLVLKIDIKKMNVWLSLANIFTKKIIKNLVRFFHTNTFILKSTLDLATQNILFSR